LVRVGNVIEKLCKAANRLGAEVIELINEFLDGLFRDGRCGYGRWNVSEKIAIFGG